MRTTVQDEGVSALPVTSGIPGSGHKVRHKKPSVSRHRKNENRRKKTPGAISLKGPQISKKTRRFINAFFPGLSDQDWNDWRWQIKHRFTTPEMLERVFPLTERETEAFGGITGKITGITPYYLSLVAFESDNHPLRKTIVPSPDEMLFSPEEDWDPLKESKQNPVPGIVHRYPDRVLFLATDYCSVFCRYCTRSRMIKEKTDVSCIRDRWQKGLDYIRKHREIRDVLISGGDPLTLADEQLEWLLKRLRRIPHVEIIRIGTKVPMVLPMRITRKLTAILKKYHPLWMSIHVTHSVEFSPETAEACDRLLSAGIPLMSQTVLLKGVNDDETVMKNIMQGLLKIRVKPYYLYQCDPIPGTGHFRTSVQRGIEIIRSLRGHTSGYAVPQFIVDAPGGGGKIPVNPAYVVGREETDLILNNYEGRRFTYPDVHGVDLEGVDTTSAL